LGKEILEVAVGDRVGEIAYVQFAGHSCPPLVLAGKLSNRQPELILGSL
jgi:hypothetical protein